MSKKMKDKEIFRATRDHGPMQWKDIKHLDFQDEDVIISQWVEPYYSENNSWDGHYQMSVYRKVPETDAEYAERIRDIEVTKAQSKERRRETYLKLKKEFEDGIPISGGEESEDTEET